MSFFQRTLKNTVSFSGVGVHSGQIVHVELRPAAANSGIVFVRSDLPNSPSIKASPKSVYNTTLATRLGINDVSVSTIEHLMAAFFGFGIDNAIVSLDGPEMPILDGSAAPFLVIIDEAGVQELKVKRKVFVVNQVIEVVDEKDPSRFIKVEPSKIPMLSYSIAFDQAKAIGSQKISMEYTPHSFCKELAFARTFCLKEEIDYLRSKGLAKGGSLENAVVVSKEGALLNNAGLRSNSEFVRHKALDCIGDLHLLGMSIIGHVIAHKAGHDLHTKLAQVLENSVAANTVFEPQHESDLKNYPALKDAFNFPASLLDIARPLTNLVTG